jgi:6-pyruvoyltetrahydropterin/6-carboxytetrahydropterin synthase
VIYVTIAKQYRTETAHRILGYDGGCRFLHGHSYLWEVTADAPIGADGLSVDFKDLKAAMVEVLEPLDHAVVLHRDDVSAQAIVADAEALGAEPGRRVHLWPVNPTAENMAVWAGREIQRRLANAPKSPQVVSVRVHETATSFAEAVAPFN